MCRVSRSGRPNVTPRTCRQRGLGAGRDHFPLVLGDGGEDVQGQLVGGGHVDRGELDTGFHQVGDEGDVARRRSSLAITSMARRRRHSSRAAASWGRSARLPLSTSVNSATSSRTPTNPATADLCASSPIGPAGRWRRGSRRQSPAWISIPAEVKSRMREIGYCTFPRRWTFFSGPYRSARSHFAQEMWMKSKGHVRTVNAPLFITVS
jgi:hypothetical protein